jgi:hypothetical protein
MFVALVQRISVDIRLDMYTIYFIFNTCTVHFYYFIKKEQKQKHLLVILQNNEKNVCYLHEMCAL